MPKLTLHKPDEEHLTILLDGAEVGSANHDSHGWSGMDAVENLATNLATRLGWDVAETYGEEADED